MLAQGLRIQRYAETIALQSSPTGPLSSHSLTTRTPLPMSGMKHRLAALLLMLLGALFHQLTDACFGGQRRTARVDENPKTDWSLWSECSLQCGDGKQTRWRSSILIPSERESESRPCGDTCVETYDWSAWTAWSDCSATCGSQGITSRSRECVRASDGHPLNLAGQKQLSCPGEWLQTQACNQIECPPVVQWTRWSSWSACTKTCGLGGRQTRTRECLTDRMNPAPASMKNCSSNEVGEQSQSCNEAVPCPSLPEWQSWSSWSSCSVTCGAGRMTRTRIRQCHVNLPPGSCIQPSVAMESQSNVCNNGDCPKVNGGWSAWNPWSNCLVTCGWGFRVRNRLCNNPEPSGGGSDCGSSSAGYENCLGGECPVDGQWGAWAPCPPALGGPNCNTMPRGQCSPGIVLHCRNCDNPKPEFGGSPCITGLASIRRDCWNIDACDNSIVQPPMNFSIVGFLNSLDLLIKWKRAPYGLVASSFFITWSVVGTDLKGHVEIPVASPTQQETLGESYEFWLRNQSTNSVIDAAIATRSTAVGTPKVSSSLRQSFRVSRVDGGWGAWNSYGACSPTADCNIPGWRTRTRQCDNPRPTNDGLSCVGSGSETSRCFHPC